MNLPKLQDDFLKRFGETENTVHYFSAPIAATLLGTVSSVVGGSVLLLPLDIKTAIAMRKRSDNQVIIQNSMTDIELKLSIGSLDKDENTVLFNYFQKHPNSTGVDILYHFDTSYVDEYNTNICTACAISKLFKSGDDILKTITCTATSPLSAAIQYACVNSKKQEIFCVNTKNLTHNAYHLNLPPHDIIFLQNEQKKSPHEKLYDKTLQNIRRQYPHIKNIDSLTTEDILSVTDKKCVEFLKQVLVEQSCMKSCIEALCNNDIRKFADILNKYHDIDPTLSSFLEKISSFSGVLASFITADNNICCIVERDLTDSVTKKIYDMLHKNMTFIITQTADGFTVWE